MIQEETENPNSSISSKDIELVNETFSQKKFQSYT